MSHTNDEKWHECDFVGVIIKYEDDQKEKREVEILDDYDVRNGFGGRFHVFKSRLERMDY